jgi:hypothetical protein
MMKSVWIFRKALLIEQFSELAAVVRRKADRVLAKTGQLVTNA